MWGGRGGGGERERKRGKGIEDQFAYLVEVSPSLRTHISSSSDGNIATTPSLLLTFVQKYWSLIESTPEGVDRSDMEFLRIISSHALTYCSKCTLHTYLKMGLYYTACLRYIP